MPVRKDYAAAEVDNGVEWTLDRLRECIVPAGQLGSGELLGLAALLDELVVEATSPDGLIGAQVGKAGRLLTVVFHSRGVYKRYGSEMLARQLAQLATVVFARYQRAERDLVDAELGEASIHGDSGTAGAGSLRLRYLAALRQVTAHGRSSDGDVEVSSRGMVSWHVGIPRGTVARLSEAEFLGQLHEAAAELVGRYGAKVALLKDEIYDLGYPDACRQALGLGDRAAGNGVRW
jgi:hypothetical protein